MNNGGTPVAGTIFQSLALRGWRQFKAIDINFHPQVTILTGRNGTGKTSLLNLLAQHGQFHTGFIGTPSRGKSGGGYFSDIWSLIFSEKTPPPPQAKIGSISYSNGVSGEILVNSNVPVDYRPTIQNQQAVYVLNITSHRRLPSYRPVQQIPASPTTSQAALDTFQGEYWNSLRGQYSQHTPELRMKESLISMALLGRGNDIVSPNPTSFAIFEDFQTRLREILPENIGFRRIRIQMPDVVLETASGDFLIDAASGGLMSLIQITWEITLFAQEKSVFTVMIDEPENHLHPSMQREFLPALTSAFPEAQFLIATHSPFVVSSIKEAAIYAFDIELENFQLAKSDDLSGSRNAVVSLPVNLNNKTSAADILTKVLGVPMTIPIWAERELDAVAQQFSTAELNSETISRIHAELKAKGLGEFFPDAIAEVAKKNA